MSRNVGDNSPNNMVTKRVTRKRWHSFKENASNDERNEKYPRYSSQKYNLREIYRRLLITIDFFNRWRSAYSNKSGKTQSLPRPRDDFQRIYRL